MIIVVVLGLLITYFSGPKVPHPVYTKDLPELPEKPKALENYVQQQETGLPLRKNNEARILWYSDEKQKTQYSIVYLHGFGASYMDGYPVNVQIADTLEANIFLARLPGHGLTPGAAMDNFTAEAAWASAREALAIGKSIGEKVIIMSTSTGGTLALKLAATYPESVYALINMSPNVEDEVEGAFVLSSRWGYEIAKLISLGKKREIDHQKPIAAQYFDTVYPATALVDLQVLLSTTMEEETFNQIKCPVLTLFYYENFLEEDEHVEVEEYPEMHAELATPAELKKLVRLEAPQNHFMGSFIKSQNTEVVVKEIVEFLSETLGIPLQQLGETGNP